MGNIGKGKMGFGYFQNESWISKTSQTFCYYTSHRYCRIKLDKTSQKACNSHGDIKKNQDYLRLKKNKKMLEHPFGIAF